MFNFFKNKKEETKTEEKQEEPQPTPKPTNEIKKEQPNYKKPLSEIENKLENKKIIEVIKNIKDPELDIDIWSLELIYDIDVKDNNIDIKMTFTSPMCPFGPQLVSELKDRLKEIGLEPNVEVVFSPPWQPSEETKEILGLP